MESTSTVYVLEDDPVYRDSLVSLLGSMGYAVRTFATAQECLDALADDRANCLVLDVRLPDANGLELFTRIRELAIQTPVVVLTGFGEVRDAVRAHRDGAVAFLQKHMLREGELWEAIESALSTDAERRQVEAKRRAITERFALLSPPEVLVLELLLAGKDNTAIAELLGISRRTVENRRAKIMTKLDVATFPQLVRMAVDAAFIKPDSDRR